MAALGTATINPLLTPYSSGISYTPAPGTFLGPTGIAKLTKFFDWAVNPAVPLAGLIWPTGSPIIAAAIKGHPIMVEDTTSSYSYIGTAPDGTPESSTGWTITRISMTSPPVTTHATGIWTDRASLTYS